MDETPNIEVGKALARDLTAAIEAERVASRALSLAAADHRATVQAVKALRDQAQAHNAVLRGTGPLSKCPRCRVKVHLCADGALPQHQDQAGEDCRPAAAAAGTPTTRCTVCGQKMKRGLPAHQVNGRWCKGGGTPTEAQKNRAAKGKSVRAVGGGLPTLGKR